ncbi:hypothetical protein BHM03_00050018 [Ensete ventricosum]|nr:hypothetical protein BHM03_00050018 [Ensete ventricosum]
MSRRVRRRCSYSRDKEKVTVPPPYPEAYDHCEIPLPAAAAVDWTALPDDTVVQIFSRLNYRDRAGLASTCRAWRLLGSSPSLWTSLDLRAHRCDLDTAAALAGRCAHLRRLRFHGSSSASALINLQARGLREIAGDYCRDITDATLSVLAARHEALESLQIGPEPCGRITSDAVRHVAMCCTMLRRLRLSGIREINGEAINALARHCPRLAEVAFLDCSMVDEGALEKVVSLKFLSVAGSRNLKWATASLSWSNLPSLVGVDVSRTDISASAVSRLLSTAKTLKVLCALNCAALEEEGSHSPTAFSNTKGKLLFAQFTDVFKGIASLFRGSVVKEQTLFEEWRSLQNEDKILSDIMNWLEWILSHSLLRIAESNPHGMDEFWLRQGAALLLSLVKSSQEDVQERAATGLATFVVTDDENATVEPARAEAVMRNGGIPLLLELARSCREGVQSEAAKAAIAEAGGVKALVNLIFKWTSGVDGVLERAAGALANLAADDKCSVEIAMAGGVHALVTLARLCKVEGVQEQV